MYPSNIIIIFLSQSLPATAAALSTTTTPIVSYVIEPFDTIPVDDWNRTVIGDGNLLELSIDDDKTTTTASLFGNASLRIEYEIQQTRATAEALVGIEHHLSSLPSTYNCIGASYLSLWYKVIQPQPFTTNNSNAYLRIVLVEATDYCVQGSSSSSSCADQEDQWEVYASIHRILDGDNATTTEQKRNQTWREIRIEVNAPDEEESSFRKVGGSGGFLGNGLLDLDRIIGWRIEFVLDSKADVDALVRGVVAIDQLACVGGGELFGAAFQTTRTFHDALNTGQWEERYTNSAAAKAMTEVSLENGSFKLNYTVQKTETWGGSTRFEHVTPARAYYNLSQAQSVAMCYQLVQAATPAGRVHFRFDLMDGSECGTDCAANRANMENYFSFLFILDEEQGKTANISLDLVGSSNRSSPFWLTGWSGTVGDQVLDSSHISGFVVEVSADSLGDMYSLVSGKIILSNLTALAESATVYDSEGKVDCIEEPDLIFRADMGPLFKISSFRAERCCEECSRNKSCVYGQSSHHHCHMTSYVDHASVDISNSEYEKASYSNFWVDDIAKRGDFCERCVCKKVDSSIDCRSKNLTIVPKTFSPKKNVFQHDAVFRPKTLDLRGNPLLVLVGTTALDAIVDTLEELMLPSQLKFLAPSNLRNLTSLRVVVFEDAEDRDQANVIADSSELFSDVCCSRGTHVDLESPSGGLIFCNMTLNTPGIDSVYEPFVEYVDGKWIEEITWDSNFMSEAAEDAKKCAEYCHIKSTCNYFSFDARSANANNRCLLLATNGTPTVVMQEGAMEDYGNTHPPWTSGRVPRTRRDIDNARVLLTHNSLKVDKSNGYRTQMEFSLGSMPLRGAVWIKPKVVSKTVLEVEFLPERVVLYDNASFATIVIDVKNVDAISRDQTIVITNDVEACDVAFSTASPFASQESVAIHVVKRLSIFYSFLLVVLIVMATIVVFLCWYNRGRRFQLESMWLVQPCELKFGNPPGVIGRGTFGLVLLGEYRGTQVAVKRVLPPRESTFQTRYVKGTHSSLSAAFHFGGNDTEATTSGHYNEEDTERFLHADLASQGSRRGCIDASFFGCSEHTRLKSQFRAEMRHLSKLRHPCITTVMGAIVARAEEPMLIMEYMELGSLYDVLHNETMIVTGEHILPILRDLAQGLRFLHAATPQVVHGDLKAANVLLDYRFRAKVTDFGLSQKQRLGASGTPYWMAPELLRGESGNTTASDVYSFGIVLFEVYSRSDPYEGEDYEYVMRLVADPLVDKRPPVPEACPAKIRSIMVECLDRIPANRPSFEGLDYRLKDFDATNVEPGESCFSKQVGKQRRTEGLLFDVFPPHVAKALRDGQKIEPESHEMVTIFFSDIVGFTKISTRLSPMKISDMLDRLYKQFDAISREHDVFKVETIGDAWMGVTNLISDQPDHVKRIADFAADALRAANATLIDVDYPNFGCINIRVGFHSGPVVANVVGSRNSRYCLFGDAVNTASRMESNSEKNRIHCSEKSAMLLCQQDPNRRVECRGKIKVKGKGEMITYWVDGGPSGTVPRSTPSREKSDIVFSR